MLQTLILGIGIVIGWIISYVSFKSGASIYRDAFKYITEPEDMVEEEGVKLSDNEFYWNQDEIDAHIKDLENYGLQEEDTEPRDEDFEELPN